MRLDVKETFAMNLLDRLSSLSTVQVRLASILFVVVVGVADFRSGSSISLSLFYLIPIVFASWYDRRTFAFTLSVMSSLSWFLAEIVPPASIPVPVAFWNASSRLVIFAFVVWIIGSIRRTKLARLQDELDKYARIVETAVEGVLALDRDGCIHHANSQAMLLLGYDAIDLLGRKYTDLVWDDEGRALLDGMRLRESGHLPAQLEVRFVKKDGSTLWTIVNISSTFDQNKRPDGTILLITDISDRKRVEENLRHHLEEIVALQHLSSALVRSHHLDRRLEDAVRTVLDVMKFDAGAIYLVDKEGRGLALQQSVGFRQQSLPLIQRWEVGRGITGRVYQTGQPWFVEDALHEATMDPNVRKLEDIRGFAAVPLVSKDAALGVLNIIKREPYPFSQSTRAMLATFGSQIGVAVENARLYEDAQAREQQVRRLSVNLMRIQEEERKKFARELHEGLAQLLTMMRVNAELALDSMGKTVEAARQHILEVVGLIGEAEVEAKQISHDLRPAILDDFGLKAAIEVLARNFQRRTGVAVDLHLPLSDDRFDSVIETTVYRIVQELLANVAKHAHASRVTLQVLARNRVLALSIADNGRGFRIDKVLTSAPDGTHNGLRNMRERAESVKGVFHVESAPGKGTEFLIEIPCVIAESEAAVQEPVAL